MTAITTESSIRVVPFCEANRFDLRRSIIYFCFCFVFQSGDNVIYCIHTYGLSTEYVCNNTVCILSVGVMSTIEIETLEISQTPTRLGPKSQEKLNFSG